MAVEFEIPTARVPVGESGYFDVRGLNSEDLTFLTINYLDDMKRAVAEFGSRVPAPKSPVAEIVVEVAKRFPSMTTEIISRAADATSAEDVEKFRRLPFGTQVTALRDIAILTTTDGGVPLGKLTRAGLAILEANGVSSGPLLTLLQSITSMSENPSPS